MGVSWGKRKRRTIFVGTVENSADRFQTKSTSRGGRKKRKGSAERKETEAGRVMEEGKKNNVKVRLLPKRVR